MVVVVIVFVGDEATQLGGTTMAFVGLDFSFILGQNVRMQGLFCCHRDNALLWMPIPNIWLGRQTVIIELV